MTTAVPSSPNLLEVGSGSYPRTLCRGCMPQRSLRKAHTRLHAAGTQIQGTAALVAHSFSSYSLCNREQASKPPWGLPCQSSG